MPPYSLLKPHRLRGADGAASPYLLPEGFGMPEPDQRADQQARGTRRSQALLPNTTLNGTDPAFRKPLAGSSNLPVGSRFTPALHHAPLATPAHRPVGQRPRRWLGERADRPSSTPGGAVTGRWPPANGTRAVPGRPRPAWTTLRQLRSPAPGRTRVCPSSRTHTVLLPSCSAVHI